MNLLCIGKTGQVARALTDQNLDQGMHLLARGRPDVDLCAPHTLKTAIADQKPDVVINAAAYTQVDRAETDQEAAFGVNSEGVKSLAELCAAANIPLIHISTDYVFDGAGTTPFLEIDLTNPINVYGASKLAGEEAVREALDQHIILRTSWVYGPYGANFVKTMLRLAKEKGEASVVDDQVGAPTRAEAIADTILKISTSLRDQQDAEVYGTYNFTAAGEASWADVAALIFEIFEHRTGCKITLNRIPSSDYPTPAARPRNSRLDTGKIETVFGIQPEPWEQGVRQTVNRLLDEEL